MTINVLEFPKTTFYLVFFHINKQTQNWNSCILKAGTCSLGFSPEKQSIARVNVS